MNPDRILCRGAALALACVLTAAAPGTELALDLAGGWSLEHFGRDVTILRGSLTRAEGRAPGSMVFSCDGGQRRLTIRLPGPLPGPLPVTGSLLLHALPPGAGAYVIARAQPEAGTYTAVEEGGRTGRGVLAFARGLMERPERLDLLLRRDDGPVALGSLTPLRVSVSWTPRDGLAFRAFVAACDSGARPQRRDGVVP